MHATLPVVGHFLHRRDAPQCGQWATTCHLAGGCPFWSALLCSGVSVTISFISPPRYSPILGKPLLFAYATEPGEPPTRLAAPLLSCCRVSMFAISLASRCRRSFAPACRRSRRSPAAPLATGTRPGLSPG